MKYHLKSNYIATINPTTLSSLTFKLTNENNETVNTNIKTSHVGTSVNAHTKGETETITIADNS